MTHPCRCFFLLLGVITLVLTGPAGLLAQGKVLHVYGPGGPLGPMEECARLFGSRHGVAVKVVAGPEAQWIEEAKQQADLIFGGAEYMLTDFMQRHPDFLAAGSRVSLWDRPAAILVRQGNPKRIRTLRDLTRPNIKLLDVNGAGQLGLWEDLAARQRLTGAIRGNIAVTTRTTAEAIEKWKNMPELDAWITFESWHHRLKDLTDVVRLAPHLRLYRGTPIAIAARTKEWELAQEFIRFLRTPEAHAIFKKWGWR